MEHLDQQTTRDRAHSMMHALQEFRRERERESSEFAAEFQRLDAAPKECLALLEAATLTPIIAACSSVLQDSSVRLIWLQTLANKRIAACFAATQDNMERALQRARETANAYDPTAQTVLLPHPPEVLRRRLLGWQPHASDHSPNTPPHRRASTADHTPTKYTPTPRSVADTTHLLEMTDDELRRIIVTLSPQISRAGLNAMRKEELVDLCRRLQHTTRPHI